MGKPVVIKVSGSLIYPLNKNYLNDFLKIINIILKKEYHPVIVIGGGRIARDYINVANQLGISKAFQDLIGISATRLNALLLSFMLYPKTSGAVSNNLEEVLEEYSKGLIPVSGGWEPGHSTNAVALIIAEAIGARTVYDLLAGIEGVYDRDPRDPKAKLLRKLTIKELKYKILKYKQVPGGYELVDHIALEIAERSNINIHFLNGSNPNNLLKALSGESIGTLVLSDK